MARLMVLCSLPRSNPGDRHQCKRVNGPYKLILSRTDEYKLPFGKLPRLLMAWVSTEAVRGAQVRLAPERTPVREGLPANQWSLAHRKATRSSAPSATAQAAGMTERFPSARQARPGKTRQPSPSIPFPS